MPNEKLVFDVGAHKGEDTEFYLKKGFSVVAIEAVPEFCAQIEERFRSFIDRGRLTVLNVAVAKSPGTVDFFIDETVSVWGTANRDWVARNRSLGAGTTRRITVAARTLGDIVREHGAPWYCKIDIEGNDLDALRSLAGSPDVPRFISIESEKRSWSRLLDEFRAFRDLGYCRYKIVDQSLVPLQTPPRPACEGEDCDHVFAEGSSGLFGEDLPGQWLSLFEAVEAYRQIFRGYALNGDNGAFSGGKGVFSLFHALGRIQAKIARLRGQSGYRNPADILPPAGWYDTHAAR